MDRKPASPPPYNNVSINSRDKLCLLSDGEKTQLKKRIYRSLGRKSATTSRH